MNPKIKKEIKEWLELIALSAVGGLVVFHINGVFSPNKEQNKEPIKTEIAKPVTTRDTIAHRAIQDSIQLKR